MMALKCDKEASYYYYWTVNIKFYTSLYFEKDTGDTGKRILRLVKLLDMPPNL
jgi:hypothetical protein